MPLTRQQRIVLDFGFGQLLVVTIGIVVMDRYLSGVLEPTEFASMHLVWRGLALLAVLFLASLNVVGCWFGSKEEVQRQANLEQIIAVARRKHRRWEAKGRSVDREFELRSRESVIFGLARLSESRGMEHDHHLDRSRDYVRVLADELQDEFAEIDEEFIRNLCLASALHDIGLTVISDDILNKPGALSKSQRAAINRHPKIGGECLGDLGIRPDEDQFLKMAYDVARHHHERWDGLGYPDGLREEQIPLAARIVCVADVYDALTTQRPHKEAMTHAQAMSIMIEASGRQFDPRLIDALVNCEERIQAIKQRYGLVDNESFDDRLGLFQEFVAQVGE